MTKFGTYHEPGRHGFCQNHTHAPRLVEHLSIIHSSSEAHKRLKLDSTLGTSDTHFPLFFFVFLRNNIYK